MAAKRELRLAKQAEVRETFKIDDKKFRLNKYLVWGLPSALILAGLVFFFIQAGQPQKFDVTQSCLSDMNVTYHIHPHLTIIVNGQPQVIPQGIGILSTCFRPLHTHSNDGIIHVESAVQRDFTLSEFFTVWGQPFDKDHILNLIRDDKHDLTMTVDGQPSDAWQNLVFKDQQQIVITYSEKKQ